MRSLLFNQKYKGKKVEIPFAWYQRLNVNFTYPSIGSSIYKSTKQIPPVLDTTNLWQYTFISTDGANTPNLNFINPQRFKTCGYNKWTSNELYGTIDLDNYMYLKSKNNKYIDISQKQTITEKTIKYGRLYNWYAATDSRGIAPEGWHVPTNDEFIELVDANSYDGNSLKEIGDTHWDSSNGTNISGLSLVGGGRYSEPYFGYIKLWGTYLSSNDNVGTQGAEYCNVLEVDSDGSLYYGNTGEQKRMGYSIRLIKDNNVNEGSVLIDNDLYETVTIGNQVWLKQNLAVKHYQNGDLIGSDFSGAEGAVIAYNNDEGNVYNLTTTTQSLPFINGSMLYDTILDNPIDADRFNDTNTLDVLDLEFPCEESLIQPIIDLCLKEISAINGIPRDATNNASDDISLPKQQ